MEEESFLIDHEGLKYPVPFQGFPEPLPVSGEGILFFSSKLASENSLSFFSPLELLEMQAIYLSRRLGIGDFPRQHLIETLYVVDAIRLFSTFDLGDPDEAFEIFKEYYIDNIGYSLFKKIYTNEIPLHGPGSDYPGIDPMAIITSAKGVSLRDTQGKAHPIIPYDGAQTSERIFNEIIKKKGESFSIDLETTTDEIEILIDLIYKKYRGLARYPNKKFRIEALLEAFEELDIRKEANYQIDIFRDIYSPKY